LKALPVAGQGRAAPALEKSLAFLHQNNRFLTTAVVLEAFSSVLGKSLPDTYFSLSLCVHTLQQIC